MYKPRTLGSLPADWYRVPDRMRILWSWYSRALFSRAPSFRRCQRNGAVGWEILRPTEANSKLEGTQWSLGQIWGIWKGHGLLWKWELLDYPGSWTYAGKFVCCCTCRGQPVGCAWKRLLSLEASLCLSFPGWEMLILEQTHFWWIRAVCRVGKSQWLFRFLASRYSSSKRYHKENQIDGKGARMSCRICTWYRVDEKGSWSDIDGHVRYWHEESHEGKTTFPSRGLVLQL